MQGYAVQHQPLNAQGSKLIIRKTFKILCKSLGLRKWTLEVLLDNVEDLTSSSYVINRLGQYYSTTYRVGIVLRAHA